MKQLSLALAFLLTGACALPAMFSGSTTEKSTSRSARSETVNGEPVEPGDPSEEAPPDDDDKPKKKKLGHREVSGETCHKNSDCASKVCFVGAGNLGYCTKMCNSWSQCPAHWECRRAENAPQKICMQD